MVITEVKNMNISEKILSYVTLDTKNFAIGVFKSIIVFAVGWWIINKVSKFSLVFFRKAYVEIGMASFLSSLLKFALRIFLLVIVMGCLGIDVTSILTAIGASFLALGISIKESLSNFISGIVLIVNKPIHVGDFIEFENSSGTVVKIEMLFTTLQTPEKDKTVIIPNARLVSSVIVRKSEYNLRSVSLDFHTSNQIPYVEVEKFLTREFLSNNSILQLPAPQVKSCDKNTKFNITVWCQNQYAEKVKRDLEAILVKLSRKSGSLVEIDYPENINSE